MTRIICHPKDSDFNFKQNIFWILNLNNKIISLTFHHMSYRRCLFQLEFIYLLILLILKFVHRGMLYIHLYLKNNLIIINFGLNSSGLTNKSKSLILLEMNRMHWLFFSAQTWAENLLQKYMYLISSLQVRSYLGQLAAMQPKQSENIC